MGTATFVKQKNGTGDGRVYRLDPPLTDDGGDGPSATYEYVWVSAVTIGMGLGCETYIFGYDFDADEVESWSELPGSMKGTLSHAEALRAAGYEVAPVTTISDARKRQATPPPIVGHAAILADMLDAAHHVGLPMPRSAVLEFGIIDLQVGPDDLRAWIDWTHATPKTPRLAKGATHFRAEGTVQGVPLVLRAVRLGEAS